MKGSNNTPTRCFFVDSIVVKLLNFSSYNVLHREPLDDNNDIILLLFHIQLTLSLQKHKPGQIFSTSR